MKHNYNGLKRPILFSALFCLLSPYVFGLKVELPVKECAGVGATGFPVSAVVPLPKGAYQNIDEFRVRDAHGNPIPAQFDIMNRRMMEDKSIANLLFRFQPRVGAFTGSGTGISTYYLQDGGTGNAKGTGLSVDDNGSVITVNTGTLKFTVKKSGCNIFDQVWLNNQLVLQADSTSGGEFIGRLPGDVQRDLKRSDVLVEVEESGPMEVVIRLEALTRYSSPSNHTHGWAIRIYAYAGKSFVKIDYQLQNS